MKINIIDCGCFFSAIADISQSSEGLGVSVTRQELIEYCLTYPSAVEDYPFEDRSTTIKDCDRIVMLEGGSYDELLSRGGKFAEPVARQRADI